MVTRSAPLHGIGVTMAAGTGVSPGAGVPETAGAKLGWNGFSPVTVQAAPQSRSVM